MKESESIYAPTQDTSYPHQELKIKHQIEDRFIRDRQWKI